MTINTDIKNAELTKFAKYIFFIEQALFFPLPVQEAMQKLEPTLSETFKPMNVFIDDDNISDYNIKEEMDKNNPQFIFFITCDTRNPRFKYQLNVLRDHKRFVDCYQYQDIHSNTAVIRFKVTVKQRVIKMIESNYSEMYQAQERPAVVNNMTVQRLYSKYNPKTKENEFDDAIHILLRSSEMFERLVNKFELTDTDTIEALKEQEFDSKYRIEQETLRFTHEVISA
jgi:hypothetical protein